MYCPGTATVDKHLVVIGLVASQLVGDPEPVDHRGLAAGAVEGEAVEELRARARRGEYVPSVCGSSSRLVYAVSALERSAWNSQNPPKIVSRM